MDAEELRGFLQHIGIVILHNHTGDVIFSLFYGMFIVIFWLSTLAILQKGFSSRATQATFIATLTGFLIMTIYWASTIAASTIIIRVYSTNNTNATLEGKVEQAGAAAYIPDIVTVCAQYLLPVVSDIVVIWRAWVLYPQQRWVMIGPLVLLLATLGTTLAGMAFDGFLVLEDSSTTFFAVAAIMSITMNALSTLLIFYKLWTYRKFIRKNIGVQHRRSHVHNILVLLVESGLLFLALQIEYLIFTFLPLPELGSAYDLVSLAGFDIFIGISGMYPTIVVILVHYQSCTEETYGISALVASGKLVARDDEARPATASHLSFAVPPSMIESASTGALDGQADAVEEERSRVENHQDSVVDVMAEKDTV